MHLGGFLLFGNEEIGEEAKFKITRYKSLKEKTEQHCEAPSLFF